MVNNETAKYYANNAAGMSRKRSHPEDDENLRANLTQILHKMMQMVYNTAIPRRAHEGPTKARRGLRKTRQEVERLPCLHSFHLYYTINQRDMAAHVERPALI